MTEKMNRPKALQTLGLDIAADKKKIHAAFRRLAAQYHPDKQIGKGPEEKKLAEESYQKVNDAYSVLSEENAVPSFASILAGLSKDGEQGNGQQGTGNWKRSTDQGNSRRSANKQDPGPKTYDQMQDAKAKDWKEANEEEGEYLVKFHAWYNQNRLHVCTSGYLQFAKQIVEMPGNKDKKLAALDFFGGYYLEPRMAGTKWTENICSAKEICHAVRALCTVGKQDDNERFGLILNIVRNITPSHLDRNQIDGLVLGRIYGFLSGFKNELEDIVLYSRTLDHKGIPIKSLDDLEQIIERTRKSGIPIAEARVITDTYYHPSLNETSIESFLSVLGEMHAKKELLAAAEAIAHHIISGCHNMLGKKDRARASVCGADKTELLLRALRFDCDIAELKKTVLALAGNRIFWGEKNAEKRLDTLAVLHNEFVAKDTELNVLEAVLNAIQSYHPQPTEAVPAVALFFELANAHNLDPLAEAKLFSVFKTHTAMAEAPWANEELESLHKNACMGGGFADNLPKILHIYFTSENARPQVIAYQETQALKRKANAEQKRQRTAERRQLLQKKYEKERTQKRLAEEKTAQDAQANANDLGTWKDYIAFFEKLANEKYFDKPSADYKGFANAVAEMNYPLWKKTRALDYFYHAVVRITDADMLCHGIDALCTAGENDNRQRFASMLKMLEGFKLHQFRLEDCNDLAVAYKELSRVAKKLAKRKKLDIAIWRYGCTLTGSSRKRTYAPIIRAKDIPRLVKTAMAATNGNVGAITERFANIRNTRTFHHMFDSVDCIIAALPALASQPEYAKLAARIANEWADEFHFDKDIKNKSPEIWIDAFERALLLKGDLREFAKFVPAISPNLSNFSRNSIRALESSEEKNADAHTEKPKMVGLDELAKQLDDALVKGQPIDSVLAGNSPMTAVVEAETRSLETMFAFAKQRHGYAERLYIEIVQKQGVGPVSVALLINGWDSGHAMKFHGPKIEDAVEHAIGFFKKAIEHDLDPHAAAKCFNIFIRAHSRTEKEWCTEELDAAREKLKSPGTFAAGIETLMAEFFSTPKTYETLLTRIIAIEAKKQAKRGKEPEASGNEENSGQGQDSNG